MWSEPATPKQIAALRTHGNHDGKYYSKGRAGETIGASIRSSINGNVPNASVHLAGRHLPGLAALATSFGATGRAPYEASAPTTGVVRAPHNHVNFIPQERTIMTQQLAQTAPSAVPDVTSVVEEGAHMPPNAVPFEFIGELERKHLATVAKRLGSAAPAEVRAVEKGWATTKVAMAAMFARAHIEVVLVLQQAPAGTFVAPEVTAREMLWGACSRELEKQLLEAAHQAHTSSKPSHVLDELLAQVDHRIQLAKIYAQGQVEVAKIQSSMPPATRGYQPTWGQVTGLKPFGVFIRLQTGESGLLHKSEMRALNGGSEPKDAGALFNVGQWVQIRVADKNVEGKLSFALAEG